MRNFTLHTGATVSAADTFHRRFGRQLARLGLQGRHHMRVGRFSVTTLSDGTCAVAAMYQGLCDDGSIRPGTRFWASHVRDRMTQLDRIEQCIAGHPLAGAVMRDVDAERAHWGGLS